MAAVTQMTQASSPSLVVALGDDPLRNVLTFLSPAACRRGVGTAAKLFRAAASSAALARDRGADKYVLRNDTHGVVHLLGTDKYGLRSDRHGVVHALATACGTRPWLRVGMVPRGLTVTGRTCGNAYAGDFGMYAKRAVTELNAACGRECRIGPGTFVEYQLPFLLLVSHFSLSYPSCGRHYFQGWVFEAFDLERESRWVELYKCDRSPWADRAQSGPCPAIMVPVDASFGASRFRIRVIDQGEATPPMRCFHPRELELFGTVLPPWRID